MSGSIKAFLKKCKHSKNIFSRLIYRCALALLLCSRFLTKSRYRSEVFYGLLYAKNYHQRSSFTVHDRYPDLFAICQNFFKAKKPLRLLSFGCSTGEEVESLSQHFPQAALVGTDINKRSIKLARLRYGNERKSFLHSLSSQFEQARDFDIIFCCAVFQSTANRTSTNNTVSDYPFNQFESTLQNLDKKLSKGGLLVIDHSDFRFIHTSLSQKYQPLEVEGNQIRRKRPCYNSQNQKVSDFTENDRVFVKMTD